MIITKKINTGFATALLLMLSFSFIVPFYAEAADPPAIDTVNWSNVDWADTNVSSWTQTSEVQSVTFSGRDISFPHTKAGVWPANYNTTVFPGVPVEGNLWVFAYRNGKWQAATAEWLRPGQTVKKTSNITDACGALHGGLSSFTPAADELMGFMVSGLARSSDRNVEERSNVYMQRWTGITGKSAPNACSSTPAPTPTSRPTPTFSLTSVSPAQAAFGDTLTLRGYQLTDTVQFTAASGQKYTYNGSVNSAKTILTISVPAIPLGTYSVTVYKSANQISNARQLTLQTKPGAFTPPTPKYLDLGDGAFPDAVWYQDRLWVAYKTAGSRIIDLLSFDINLADKKTEKVFNLSTGAGGFPRLTVFSNTLWVAFRDGEASGEDIKLWRRDTDKIESLGAGIGNDPVALGSGYILWQKPEGSFATIYKRSLTGGSVSAVQAGAPTGISRVTSGGSAVLIDKDREAVSWGVRAWFASPLIVATDVTPHDDNGIAVRFNNDPASEFNLWTNERAHTPHAATDGKGNYAVVTWNPNVRVAVFKGLVGGATVPDDEVPVCDPWPEDVVEMSACNEYYGQNPSAREDEPGTASNPITISGLPGNPAGAINGAYSEKHDSVLLATQKIVGAYSESTGGAGTQIVGVLADPKTLEPKGSVFRIDSDNNSYHAVPKVAYSPDGDVYLVAWEDTRPCGKNCRSIYGRLVSGDGKPVGNSDFAIDLGQSFLGDVVYDPVNKKFIVGYEPGYVAFRTIDPTSGSVSPEVTVVSSFPYQGQFGIAVNTNNNEYWFAYTTVFNPDTFDTPNEDDRIFFSRVNATTLQVIGDPVQLSRTRLGRVNFSGSRIAYSPQSGGAIAIWNEGNREGISGTWGRTIYDDGSLSEEYPVITPSTLQYSDGYGSSMVNYNPWTDTFFVSSGDWNGNAWISELDVNGIVYSQEIALSVVPTTGAVGSFNITQIATPQGAVTFASQNYSRLVGTVYNSPSAPGPRTSYPTPGPSAPPTPVDVTAVGKLVAQVYLWALAAAALLALLVIVFGGYKVMTAGGNGKQASDGKEYLYSAIVGLVILLSSYLILSTINPDLTDFSLGSLNSLNGAPTAQQQ